MHDRPKARTNRLVSERIEDELVVYDQVNNVAHCLSARAASVWDLCDGVLSQAEIAERLGVTTDIVARAIESLAECRLLDEGPVDAPGYSRRQAAIRLVRIGGAALTAPLVYSIDVGTAAAKASHLAAGCTVTTCGSCSSTTGCSLCTSPGTTNTNSMCASGRCYCSRVTSTGTQTTVLRCAIGSTCRGDFLAGSCTGSTNPRCDCTTAGQCCGNNCVSGQCRSAAPSC